jgi:beta-lactamase class A
MNRAIVGRILSRRRALAAGGTGIAAALGAASLGGVAAASRSTAAPLPQKGDLTSEVVGLFNRVPGRKGLKFWAPAATGLPEWSATLNPSSQLFVASAFKAYVLAAYLRQVEAALDPAGAVPIGQQLEAHLAEEWPLDESVFSLDSVVFNPPHLTGKVQALTALEAMISRSDNTGADMTLANAGADRVREFIASIGLRDTRIPTSTRQFAGYIFGLPDWQATTWAQLEANTNYPPRPIINDQITMASTADDFVSFYSRALQGEFFRYPETLAQFRAILMLADAIPQSVPLGVSAFLKGGEIGYQGNNALTVAGGLYIPNRWVYFSMLHNWTDAEAGPAAEVLQQNVTTVSEIFRLVRDRLGG